MVQIEDLYLILIIYIILSTMMFIFTTKQIYKIIDTFMDYWSDITLKIGMIERRMEEN